MYCQHRRLEQKYTWNTKKYKSYLVGLKYSDPTSNCNYAFQILHRFGWITGTIYALNQAGFHDDVIIFQDVLIYIWISDFWLISLSLPLKSEKRGGFSATTDLHRGKTSAPQRRPNKPWLYLGDNQKKTTQLCRDYDFKLMRDKDSY